MMDRLVRNNASRWVKAAREREAMNFSRHRRFGDGQERGHPGKS